MVMIIALIQELTGHSTHINCVCFDLDGQFLFSGDNKGTIKMWESPEGHATGFESSTEVPYRLVKKFRKN